MGSERGTKIGYISVAIDAARQPFTVTFLAFFVAAVLVLVCNHYSGLIDLAAVDPVACESIISGALGSGALAISEIFGDVLSFHHKKRLLAQWRAAPVTARRARFPANPAGTSGTWQIGSGT